MGKEEEERKEGRKEKVSKSHTHTENKRCSSS